MDLHKTLYVLYMSGWLHVTKSRLHGNILGLHFLKKKLHLTPVDVDPSYCSSLTHGTRQSVLCRSNISIIIMNVNCPHGIQNALHEILYSEVM